MTSINIRQASIDDLPLILSFTHAIHLQEDDQSIPTNPNFLSHLEKWLKQELENSLSLFLIAEIQSELKKSKEENITVGFIGSTTVINDNGFLINPTKGVIHLLWVEKKYRRQGISKQLVTVIESCFKENAINVIECSFTKKNTLAEHFWNDAGYQVQSLTARKILTQR